MTANPMRATFFILLVVVLLALVWLLQPILSPFLAGIALAYLGDPLVDRLEARGLNRTLGVVVVFVVLLALLAGALLVLVPLLFHELSSLVSNIPAFVEWLQKTTSPTLVKYFGVDPFDVSVADLRSRLAANWQQAGGLASHLLAQITASGFAMVSWSINLALVPVVAFYLMRDWDRLIEAIRGLIPREVEPTAVHLTKACDEVLSAFIRGQLLIMVLLGCIYAIGLGIAGIELAVL
ncbi:MAG TPA: AI-2E family transporter, partial [Pseudomonadales bacterium]|nr:AI-2E family transporter [Pseudomonadales bacterium]